ncbi:MAG: MATE family efflux transporter [Saprospiraceae bacterium]|nr:MATE family efflux transporter [Saprospiraceae bacterium]MCB9321122.1 MATE family efflux transporter [Lewinellaceae bacterium]
MLAVPMILEMSMESLFAVVDVFFVSKVGVNAVATVGFTESVLTLVYSIAWGLSMGATAMVSRRIGEQDREGASSAAAQAMWIGISLSLLLGIPGYFYADEILRAMGGSESLIQEGRWYTKILFGSNIVILLIFLLNGIFRGAGNAAIAMRTLWISNGLNLILDPCLIFGWGPFPEMGVSGAALATSIGRGTGVIFQLYHLFWGKDIIRIAGRHLKILWSVILRLFRVSIGGMGQFIIGSSSWIFLMRIIGFFGEEVVAGYTIAIRVLIFTLLPAWGMANAAATLVGQNLGANQPDRAERSVWKTAHYTMLFMLGVSIIYFLCARPIMLLFNPDPVVVENGILSLRIICAGYLFFAYGMVISQAFNGAGDTFTPTVLNLICFWFMQIPLAYIVGITWGFGPSGIFASVAVSESFLAVLCVIVFRRGRWKSVRI